MSLLRKAKELYTGLACAALLGMSGCAEPVSRELGPTEIVERAFHQPLRVLDGDLTQVELEGTKCYVFRFRVAGEQGEFSLQLTPVDKASATGLYRKLCAGAGLWLDRTLEADDPRTAFLEHHEVDYAVLPGPPLKLLVPYEVLRYASASPSPPPAIRNAELLESE